MNERVAITRTLPAGLRAYPAGCVQFRINVSNNGRYANAGPVFLIPWPISANDPCLRYASNGYFILRKAGARWTVIYNGSVEPPCSLGIPRDLERCIP